jgi:hypothetical protein
MRMFAGLDVGFKRTAVCVVDEAGRIVWRGVVDTHPEALSRALQRWSGKLKFRETQLRRRRGRLRGVWKNPHENTLHDRARNSAHRRDGQNDAHGADCAGARM